MSSDEQHATGGGDALEIWLASAMDSPFDAATLTADDDARYRRLRSPRQRKEFELSRSLLRRFVSGNKTLSVSHSGGLAAVAACAPGIALGIDIEVHKARDVISLAQFAFDPDEADALARHPDALDRFYELWVLKEAGAKALGLQLVEALRRCVFRIDNTIVGGSLPTDEPWQASVWRARPDLSLGLVVVGVQERRMIHAFESPADMPGHWAQTVSVAGGGAIPL
jgi:phosphopantetheinyl transferase